MPLKKIEIIGVPCSKWQDLEYKIKQAVRQIEFQNKMKYNYEFKKTGDLREASKYSSGVLPPLVVINGALEFSGKVPTVELLKRKILSIIVGR